MTDIRKALDGTTHDRTPNVSILAATTEVPCLTIAAHPDPARVGERARLDVLLGGAAVDVSRRSPDFATVEGPRTGPLADPCLSRTPIRFGLTRDGGVTVERGECGMPVIFADAPLGPVARADLDDLAEGVPILLGGRVVLVLHSVPLVPGRAGRDTLGFVGSSPALDGLREQLEQVADLAVPVLLLGESGTGKELCARALHERSRRAGPFVAVDMAAVPATTAASELFGHVRGSFTGAHRDHPGRFRSAHGGTLFLDEVADTPPDVQAMLLRTLESGEVVPVGGTSPVRVDVRVVAATDVRLEEAVQAGAFRSALLHRLSGYEVRVPPLRRRRDDIGRLLFHFLRESLAETGETEKLRPAAVGEEPWLPAALALRFVRHPWPGNVRQLRNAARQLAVSSRGRLVARPDDALEALLGESSPEPPVPHLTRLGIEHLSDDAIREALRLHGHSVTETARALGVGRSTLYDRIMTSPGIHLARDLSTEAVRDALDASGGDVRAAARVLEVSPRSLRARMKEFGLG